MKFHPLADLAGKGRAIELRAIWVVDHAAISLAISVITSGTPAAWRSIHHDPDVLLASAFRAAATYQP